MSTVATSAQSLAATAGNKLSTHPPRQVVEKIRVNVGNKLFTVKAPPEIVERWRGRGIAAKVVIDRDHAVICLTPDEKITRTWGANEHHGIHDFMTGRENLVGWSEKWPGLFGATAPTSVNWGHDGVLRLHMPKNLKPLKVPKHPAKGWKKKSTLAKEAAAAAKDPGASEAAKVKGIIPEATTPLIPAGNKKHQAQITSEMMKHVTAGLSTTLMLSIPSEMKALWPDSWGVTVRALMDADRPVLFVRPDPDGRAHWGKKMSDGSHYAIVQLDDVDFVDELPKFKKVRPFLANWHGEELMLKLPYARDLKPPKKSAIVVHTRPQVRQEHSGPSPAVMAQTLPPTAPPAAELPKSHEERLRFAISELNQLRTEMGDDLKLSIKDDGGVKATIQKEFE